MNTSIYCFRRSILAPAAAPAEPGQRPGRVLPDRRRRASCSAPATGSQSLVLRRPHGGGRGQRPGPAGRGRGRAAGPDQRALDAPRRHHVGPRTDLRRRRGGARDRRVPAARGDPARCAASSETGSEIGPNCVLTDTVVGDGSGGDPEHVSTGAPIGDGARVGPFACSQPGAEVGPDAVVPPHSVVAARAMAARIRPARPRHSSVRPRGAHPATASRAGLGPFPPEPGPGHRRTPRCRARRGQPARIRQRRDLLPVRHRPSGAATSSSSRRTAAR